MRSTPAPVTLPAGESESAYELIAAFADLLAALDRVDGVAGPAGMFFVRQADRIRAIANDCLFELNVVPAS
jgi:nitrite reductase/ring-hydroxylating ferredoxin subunit